MGGGNGGGGGDDDDCGSGGDSHDKMVVVEVALVVPLWRAEAALGQFRILTLSWAWQ
ncbi:unnamed protein product [Prunus armeniaca]|uniref:Uncharacterized protein n=1 Tax=Prunus armeniaca TaxID=36596 RepID=A0A6J5URL9_PRUAR|nr:unnamed protein product [Prunus armeniaca]